MAADVVALVDRLGFDAYDLVGYSMGAVVALLVAGRDARIRRLVVGGVGASVVEPPGPSAALDRAALADALEASDPATVTAPLLRAFRRFAERTGADLGALAAQARAEHPTPVPVDRVSAETLVLAGDRDPLAGRPEVLAAALGAELVVIPGDHLSAVADPHFVHELLRFLG
jgi:pimeloyl-ACP methyl ester carboxylesterase